MNNRDALGLIIRYFILLLIPLGNLYIIYSVFSPATVLSSFFILDKIYPYVALNGIIISAEGYNLAILPACVAGAAYYLLLILNLSTPMPSKTRAKSLLFLIFSFLILNVLRIIIFSVLVVNGFRYFDTMHELSWYFGSTILILIIWFVNIYIFKIKEIPVYSDVKSIIKEFKHK